MRLPTFYEQNLIPNWGNDCSLSCAIYSRCVRVVNEICSGFAVSACDILGASGIWSDGILNNL